MKLYHFLMFSSCLSLLVGCGSKNEKHIYPKSGTMAFAKKAGTKPFYAQNGVSFIFSSNRAKTASEKWEVKADVEQEFKVERKIEVSFNPFNNRLQMTADSNSGYDFTLHQLYLSQSQVNDLFNNTPPEDPQSFTVSLTCLYSRKGTYNVVTVPKLPQNKKWEDYDVSSELNTLLDQHKGAESILSMEFLGELKDYNQQDAPLSLKSSQLKLGQGKLLFQYIANQMDESPKEQLCQSEADTAGGHRQSQYIRLPVASVTSEKISFHNTHGSNKPALDNSYRLGPFLHSSLNFNEDVTSEFFNGLSHSGAFAMVQDIYDTESWDKSEGFSLKADSKKKTLTIAQEGATKACEYKAVIQVSKISYNRSNPHWNHRFQGNSNQLFGSSTGSIYQLEADNIQLEVTRESPNMRSESMSCELLTDVLKNNPKHLDLAFDTYEAHISGSNSNIPTETINIYMSPGRPLSAVRKIKK